MTVGHYNVSKGRWCYQVGGFPCQLPVFNAALNKISCEDPGEQKLFAATINFVNQTFVLAYILIYAFLIFY